MFLSWWFVAAAVLCRRRCLRSSGGFFKPSNIVTWHEQRFPGRRLLLQHVLVNDIHVPPHHGVDAPAGPAAILAAPVLPPFFAHGGRLREDARVAEVTLGAHDAVGTRGFQALLQIGILQNVAVGEKDRLLGQVFAQVTDVLPVRQARLVALLLSPSAVHREDAGAGAQHVLGVLESGLLGVEDADLGRHGDVEFLVQRVDQLKDELLVLLQEGAVLAAPGNTLGAPEVEVDSIAVGSYELRGVEQVVGVVGAELDEDGSVDRGVAVEEGNVVRRARARAVFGQRAADRLVMGVAVFWRFAKQAGVEHGRVAEELVLVFGGEEGSGQHAPGLSLWKSSCG